MRSLFAAAALATIAHAACADSRICHVAYTRDGVTEIQAAAGDAITVQVADDEEVQQIVASDRPDLRFLKADNLAFFKPVDGMRPQPIFIYTTKAGLPAPRLYILDWKAQPPNSGPAPCFVIRYFYPEDDAKRAAEAAAKNAAKTVRDKALARLAAPDSGRVYWKYVAQGDRTLAPAKIWDDGNSTFLIFPDNQRVPTIFAVNPDGKEATVDYTTGDLGREVVIHDVMREIRLRDGEETLSIWKRGQFPAYGQNPMTGTTTTQVERVIKGDDQ